MAGNKEGIGATEPEGDQGLLPVAVENKRLQPHPHEIFAEPTIIVKVGLEAEGKEKVFHVHKALLTHYSDFFRGAVGSGTFKEGAAGEVDLKDVGYGTFAVFLEWLYKQSLPSVEEWLDIYGAQEIDCMLLAGLYVFADRYNIPDLKTRALAIAFEYYAQDNPPSYDAVTYAFHNLPTSSPYLRLLVDAHCVHWDPEVDDSGDEEDFESLPHVFLKMVVTKYSRISRNSRSKIALGKCDYLEEPATGVEDGGSPRKKKIKTFH
ncbi:hypothetical protein N0V90_008232 [Kalmusia sp. IMI 367209]|nr:hypothetical protein N0V90_008232 [Kalmusia sp. IMI 367209]